jgi:catechol 2,3-dioxygenase-like lactoylglutathione lyase family enzyme
MLSSGCGGPAKADMIARRHQREPDMIQASGIDHIVLHVADVQRSKQFYTELLGMTAYRESDTQVFLHAGAQGVEQGVALFKRADGMPVAAGGDLNHLALKVAGGSYDALKSELEAHGVAVTGRPGDDRCIYFRDPDGHRLQLIFRR